MAKKSFKFELSQQVQMKYSDERGEVVGRAEYATSDNEYLVLYCSGNGSQVREWWSESQIIPVKNTVAKKK